MTLVRGFSKSEINIARLKYAMIILIPKEEEASTLKKFRSISLIHYSFNFFLPKPLIIDWRLFLIDCVCEG
jgi:hypothetical protein